MGTEQRSVGLSESAPVVELRELETVDELRLLEDLQRQVWGIEDVEVVPATAMRAAVHAGGLVVAAFVGDEVVGFAFGFVSTPHGGGMSGVGMHSHMAAVRPGFRRGGVGRKLKLHQAAWCAARGLRWISWTFDPLRAENAKFNLEILGARCYDYLTDFYGPMHGTLGRGLESDRLLAVWDASEASGPEPSTAGTERPTPSKGPGPECEWLLRPGDNAVPMPVDLAELLLVRSTRLLVATPDPRADVFAQPARAMEWRHAQRRTLRRALESGWVATGFVDGAYVLERPTETHT